MKQVYKITNIQNMRSYIGISICEEQTHMDRFEKHMSGLGGVWIKKDLDDGLATRDDFIIELIEEGNEPDEYYRAMEIYYVELFDTLYPKGYNGNKGNYIIITDEIKQKIRDTWNKNRAAGLHKTPTNQKGFSIWRYPDGTIKRLPCNHPDVLNQLVKHINYNPDSKVHKQSLAKAQQRLKNNGLTDAQVKLIPSLKLFGQRMLQTDNWYLGRAKLRERHAKKEFTEAELDLYHHRRPTIIEESWKTLSREERLERTSDGTKVMNSRISCPHCGIETNKGNYNRWHGNKCKTLKK